MLVVLYSLPNYQILWTLETWLRNAGPAAAFATMARLCRLALKHLVLKLFKEWKLQHECNGLSDWPDEAEHLVFSLAQVLITFSPRGVPDGYRFMDGWGSNTFKMVNAEGKQHWVKLHFESDQGTKNLTQEQALAINAVDPDYATRDLKEAIDRKEFPSWTFSIQVMPLEDADKYRFDPFDVTKVR